MLADRLLLASCLCWCCCFSLLCATLLLFFCAFSFTCATQPTTINSHYSHETHTEQPKPPCSDGHSVRGLTVKLQTGVARNWPVRLLELRIYTPTSPSMAGSMCINMLTGHGQMESVFGNSLCLYTRIVTVSGQRLNVSGHRLNVSGCILCVASLLPTFPLFSDQCKSL